MTYIKKVAINQGNLRVPKWASPDTGMSNVPCLSSFRVPEPLRSPEQLCWCDVGVSKKFENGSYPNIARITGKRIIITSMKPRVIELGKRSPTLSLGEPNCNQQHAPGHSVIEGSHEASDGLRRSTMQFCSSPLGGTMAFKVSFGKHPKKISRLVFSTPLKNISQLGWLFPIYGKIKNVPNHQPVSIGYRIEHFQSCM